MLWAVREIAENTLALGYFSAGLVEIYVGNERTKSVNLGIRVFGFIIPKTETPGQMPKKLIALDNNKYSVISLN